jgi:serine/threonine protein phosphatase 1
VPPGRTIAIGDIHGCAAALEAVLAAIGPQPDDTIVTLGDYVDRGPDSRPAIELLFDLGRHCRLVSLLGNHDKMLLAVRAGKSHMLGHWLALGGAATLRSFTCSAVEDIPQPHIDFLGGCRPAHETAGHLFVHANYLPDLPLDEQPAYVLRWESLKIRCPPPHCSGKTAILGHTAQKDGEILDLGHLKCIDTYCYGGRWLTALDVDSGRLWQAGPQGRMREP